MKRDLVAGHRELPCAPARFLSGASFASERGWFRRNGAAAAAIGSRGRSARDREKEGSMAGTMDKIKGNLKEGVGKATGDERTEAEGKADRVKGHAKDVAHDVKEGARGVRDSLKE
jgi:uncharacterized protein YjbJ (UPF0337 family)